jgi:heme-degrading monooxygenase HmoA
MFARKVAASLVSKALPEFINVMEKVILPWLRKQEGFLDLIILATHDGEEVATISFWDHEAHAETWATTGFPEAARILSRIIRAGPYVKTFEVVSSTIHELTPLQASAEADHSYPKRPSHLSRERMLD